MPDDYGSPEEWAACEAQRAAACQAYDDERRAAAVREQPRVIERLSEQVIDLEVRAFWAEALLAAAVERAEFLEDMLGLVLRGDWAPARPGLRAVA